MCRRLRSATHVFYMAFYRIDSPADGVRLGLWKIEESLDDFSTCDVFDSVCAAYANDKRRLEILCTYALLWHMTGDHTLRIAHDASGAPHLCGVEASAALPRLGISHTTGWVAVILGYGCRVAVDIERVSNRVSRVAAKFLRSDEPFDDVDSQMVAWCAKETVYKLLSEFKLVFDDMRVSRPGQEAQGCLDVDVMRDGHESVVAHFSRNAEYVLVWSTLI